MKSINLFFRIAIAVVIFLSSSYMGLALSDDRPTEKQYTVKINNIPFRRDVADVLLLRIKSEYMSKSITAYDNVGKKDLSLSTIEEDMDLTFNNNRLLLVLSDMYKDYLAGNLDGAIRTVNVVIISRQLKLDTLPIKKIDMCIDKQDNRVIYLMVYPI